MIKSGFTSLAFWAKYSATKIGVECALSNLKPLNILAICWTYLVICFIKYGQSDGDLP